MIEVLLFRKKEILIGLSAALLLAFAIIGYAASGPTVADYLAAEKTYADWLGSPKDTARYEAMEKAFQKAPALKKKYASAIAQKLLVIGRTEEGLKLAQQVLCTVKEASPLHVAFSLGSLLIEKGAYQEALEQAVALKEQMGSQEPFVLYAEVLIRIASLQQKLHNLPGEKAAWEELEVHLEKDPAAAEVVIAAFSERQIDLSKYIEERRRNI